MTRLGTSRIGALCPYRIGLDWPDCDARFKGTWTDTRVEQGKDARQFSEGFSESTVR